MTARESLLALLDAKAERLERLACEASLHRFLRAAWPMLDPAPFVDAWHIGALCEHLEAVTSGEIRRLLINIAPRSGKTSIVAVAWPVWTWALPSSRANVLQGPGVRFLCASYGARKAMEDGVTARRLIGSDWYQRQWGGRVVIAADRDNQERYDTTAGGSRINTGIPESLGKGGVIRILDDPHKTDAVESEQVIDDAIKAYREVWTTRSNDPDRGAEVIVMQRLGERDLSGYLLDTADDVVHLCIPARYETQRHCRTMIGWTDPRATDGESFWPARWPEPALKVREAELGPYGWAAQYQQRPEPRGGGIVKSDWWKVWPPPEQADSWVRTEQRGAKVVRIPVYPDWDSVIVSVDGAYTEREENDWCACTAWGLFADRAGNPKVMLMEAWRERLELHAFVRRVLDTCRRRQADALLVENKASGISAAQEVRRLSRDGEWQTHLIDPGRADKSARLHAVVPLFAGGVVYAPEREWARMVIDEVAQVPKGRYDDLADTVSQALLWLRKRGLARLPVEHEAQVIDAMTFRGNARPAVARGYGL